MRQPAPDADPIATSRNRRSSAVVRRAFGDGPFTRDEIGTSNRRGAIGLSTRGGDTGDAQVYVNLVDNYRLDEDYTVFAGVVGGMDLVDRILEGDVIDRADVFRPRHGGAAPVALRGPSGPRPRKRTGAEDGGARTV